MKKYAFKILVALIAVSPVGDIYTANNAQRYKIAGWILMIGGGLTFIKGIRGYKRIEKEIMNRTQGTLSYSKTLKGLLPARKHRVTYDNENKPDELIEGEDKVFLQRAELAQYLGAYCFIAGIALLSYYLPKTSD